MIQKETRVVKSFDGFCGHKRKVDGYLFSKCGQKVHLFAPIRCIGNKQIFTLKERQYLRERYRLCKKCWLSFVNTKEGRAIIKTMNVQ